MSFKNTLLPVANLLQSKGNLLDLSQPVVMGILNITPDSFYSNSRVQHTDEILKRAAQMVAEGAAILDIGGASTRPGADTVTATEEAERILPVVEAIAKQFPNTWISIDTYHSSVASKAVKAGAHIVNDISGGLFDPEMIAAVAELGVPYIAMHLKGNAESMHQKQDYQHIELEVLDSLKKINDQCHATGIKDMIIDPGFGFSKSKEQSFELLNNMSMLRILGKPILAGISRKSMIYKSLGIEANEALNGTTALHMVALQQGASILRVHDVKPAIEAIRLFELLGK